MKVLNVDEVIKRIRNEVIKPLRIIEKYIL